MLLCDSFRADGPPECLTFARLVSWSESDVQLGRQVTCRSRSQLISLTGEGTEGREGSEGQSHKEEDREEGSGTEEPLAREQRLYLDILCMGPRLRVVTPLLMGSVCLFVRAGLKSQSAPGCCCYRYIIFVLFVNAGRWLQLLQRCMTSYGRRSESGKMRTRITSSSSIFITSRQ